MNEETDRRIWEKVFERLLNNICKTYHYYISTECIYNPINLKTYRTIKVAHTLASRFRTATMTFPSGDAYVCDIWNCIRVLYVCALICQDEAAINDIEVVFNNYEIEMRTNDILADIDDLIEQYTSPELANGELVAWLMEFRKNRFGFDSLHELPVL